MQLSIIVICLNEERHLPISLGAINRLGHAGLDVEVIVVDGGSTDRSRAIAEEHGARVVSSPKGIPLQRNAGGRAAQGEILAYVDADVELQQGWFEAVAHHFVSTRALLLGCPPRLPPDASWIAQAYALHWGAAEGEAAAEELSDDERLLSTASLVMGRQEVFEAVGGFAEDLGVDEDTFLVLGAKERGVRLICDPTLRYLHHGEPKTLREFFKRVTWGANYEQWFAALRRGDLAQAWRPQYVYGAVFGAELAALGLSLALPVGGWQLGVPLAVGALGATTALPAIKTAHRHGAYGKVGELCVMYGAYGLATAGALLGLGRDKARRWR
jgi:glycosyltransferase involved in cell wall biosynthesis